MLFGMFGRPDIRAIRNVLRSPEMQHDVATLAVLRTDQLGVFDVQAGFDDFIVYPAVTDEVLARIAIVLGNGIRRSDIACRYGGEEFLLLLLGSSAENAVRRATEIRHSLRNLVLSLRGGATLSITASFGVAACPENGTDRDALLRAADQALYRAKNSGRDQVVAAGGAAA